LPPHLADRISYDTPKRGILKPNILVTGGAGYIGSHVCKALYESGFCPIVYDNLSAGHKWAVKWGPFIEGHLHDTTALLDLFAKFSPVAVVHMASSINVRESFANTMHYYHNNIGGSLHLLQAMLSAGIRSIVFSSTAAVYGIPHYLPLDEKHPLAPSNPYGKSKRIIEDLLEDFSKAHHLSFVSLRYFNACGADMGEEIGEAHHPETHLIPLVIQAVRDPSFSLKIFGDDHATPDGTAIRDYIHVSDLAEAHVKALRYLLEGGSSIALNLGTGEGVSVRQIIDAVAAFAQHNLNFEIKPRFLYDSPALVADPTLAQKILYWSPRHSTLSNIIATAWGWHLKEVY
jgi:UDP-glucose-4-epimerase GalE